MPLNLQSLAPDAYAAQAAFDRAAWALLDDPRLAELVKARVSQLNGCAFCLDLHTQAAAAAGVPARELHLVAAWREAPVFDARDRAALAVAEASARLDAAQPAALADAVAAAREHFDERRLAGLLLGCAAIGAWNRIAVGGGSAFPADDERAARLAAAILGTAA